MTTNNPLAGLLPKLQLGTPQSHLNLAMVPLLVPEGPSPFYFTLDDALATGLLKVTEVSESGQVPYLLLDNQLDRPVLILDGEQLVGAKQNRIVDVSILAPAKAQLKIPVSCVEQGRWRMDTPNFRASDSMLFLEARARKSEQVRMSRLHRGEAKADQGEIWDSVEDAVVMMRASAPSRAMDDVYRQSAGELGGYADAIKPAPGQAGAVFLLDGEAVSAEYLDSPAVLARLLPKLVNGVSLDAARRRRVERPAPAQQRFDDDPRAKAEAFLQRLGDTAVAPYPGVGLGEDVRFSGEGVSAAALVHEGRVLHLCAFHVDEDAPRRRERPYRR